MNDVAQQTGESVAAQVESVIENATASAATADAVNDALTEAAIRDRLSARIDDCEEGLSECQSQNEETAGDLQALEILNNQQAQMIAQMSGQVTQMAEQLTVLSTAALSQSTPPNSQAETQRQSEAPINPETSQNQSSEGEAARERTEAQDRARKSRGRVI